MADSSVSITAGSGTGIDTRTEATNGNHRQVVVIGDPSTNAGVAPVDATAGIKVDLGADNDVAVTGTVAVTQSGTWDEVGINDSGNSITVDNAQLSVVGTGTEAAAMRVTVATDSTGVLSVDDNGGALTVDGTVVVTGVSTLAEQQTQTTHLATIAGDTTSIQTAVEILDNAISGSEMQVDVVAALPAGTNAIGKLAANSGVDIGDVTLTAGTAAIGTLLPPDIDITTHTNYIKKYYTNAGAVTDGIVWSPAAGKRWHVVSMYIQTSAAATVTLEDDLAAGDSAIWKGEYAANGGATIHFGEKYPLASGEDAADLIVTTSAGNIYITVTGYEI